MPRLYAGLRIVAAFAGCTLACLFGGCQMGKSTSSDDIPTSSTPQATGADTSTPTLSQRMSENDRDVRIVQEIVPYQTHEIIPGVDIHCSPIESLTSVSRGPGVVVCDPVAAAGSAAASLADFGDGCGRWLHLVVAGQPQFGRTPTWISLSRVTHELSTSTLALDADQAAKLRTFLGVTDVAIGTIKGSPSQCTLTYKVQDLATGKPVGRPVTASGTETSIVNQLPAMGQALCRTLSVPSPNVPQSVSLTPAEMAQLGRQAWQMNPDATDDTTAAQLAKLAPKDPLAGLEYLTVISSRDETLTEGTARNLFSELPNNPIPYAQLGQIDPIDLLPYAKQVDRLFRRFPNNSLFASTDVWLHRQDHNDQAERNAAERLVRDAPDNPDAWLTFASTVSDEADEVRLGRWEALISSSEQKYLDTRYLEWYRACVIATRLDPEDGVAWLRLAESASFIGQADVADQAFERALTWDEDQHDVYGWGLEMYQPKWTDNTAKLQQVADQAAAATYGNTKDTLDVYDDLRDAGCSDDANSLLNQYESALQKQIAANPNDAQAHQSLADCYAHATQDIPAMHEYLAAIRLHPEDARLYDDLGNVYDDMNRMDDSSKAYQQAIHFDPDHKTAHFDLAFELKREHRLNQAEAQLKAALKLSPFMSNAAVYLATIYYMEKKPSQAIPEYEAAIRYDPHADVGAYTMLSYLLYFAKEYDKSIQVCDEGLLVDPDNHDLIVNLASGLQAKHEYSRAIVACQDAIEVNQNDANAHETLAESYNSLGMRDKAIAEWHTVVSLGNTPSLKDAQSFLKKYQ